MAIKFSQWNYFSLLKKGAIIIIIALLIAFLILGYSAHLELKELMAPHHDLYHR